jgi:16S rRNA (uracil1498-N3)-methyltransferase
MRDFTKHRLYSEAPLETGAVLELARDQANYLLNVLRLRSGDSILVFNGRDGEWLCAIRAEGRKQASLEALEQTRPQPPAPDLIYLFAPLKHARLDYMAQKAVEMGAGVLQPVLTRFTQVSRLNLDRLAANAIEAAEQCGILALPQIRAEQPLAAALAALEPERLLIFCDEAQDAGSPIAALQGASRGPLAVLVGPEGGFDESERALVLQRERTMRLSLGPRILRADTAAVAALAVVQATVGDWSPN